MSNKVCGTSVISVNMGLGIDVFVVIVVAKKWFLLGKRPSRSAKAIDGMERLEHIIISMCRVVSLSGWVLSRLLLIIFVIAAIIRQVSEIWHVLIGHAVIVALKIARVLRMACRAVWGAQIFPPITKFLLKFILA